ncbi:glycogen debranching N-terminal domain-containing protein [Actinotalea sp. AC32]|nr:glycogen debranching N-terminal domain-containing protein [Actinotalea sp. AC32]
MELQPLLHDLLVATSAPTQAWSSPDGQVRASGAQGLYEGDVRVLSRAELLVDGVPPETVAAGPVGAGADTVEVVALLRTVDEPGADPTVRLRRTRTVRPGVVVERVTLSAATAGDVRVPLRLELACDLAPMQAVKAGRRTEPSSARATADGVAWDGAEVAVQVALPGATVDVTDPTAPVARWDVVVPAAGTVVVTWEVHARAQDAVVLPAPGPAPWSVPDVTADDRRLAALLARALGDLDGLRMRATFAPDDQFLAAGAPWFLTLFGRDSLWAARMLLPLGTELAGGTLRTLAARQGTRVDPDTAEQPGKILHEVRAHELPLGEGDRALPPTYYGTIDATPLWLCLLHDAWRWGMDPAEVEALLPAAEAALGWMAEHGDADGDGLLEYHDEGGRGLANQGWKDSGDSVQWRDGRLARGPIALCEVQGYAHEAALAGAALLDAFARPGADRWRAWAADLADRFRASFWVRDETGPYPAIALDADKRPVDSLTSNIGHLLGTGILDADEERVVAQRLAGPDMDSGYGLRTMSTREAGYWPLRYHGGSVWTHDTAVTVLGLVRSGHRDVAAGLVEGLLAAAADLGFRLPELHAGDARGTVPAAVPYPAACRPQAWSAASAVALLTAVLGLESDVPGGTLRVAGSTPSVVGAVHVRGLRVAGAPLEVRTDRHGAVVAVTLEGADGVAIV